MQKCKNILGSRKKGAQEPHAAREPHYDYQGYTTSNLKGISLERLTLPAGFSSSYIFPLYFLLFFPLPFEHCSSVKHVWSLCLSSFRELSLNAG